MSRLRQLARDMAYRSGALGLYHRLRNRRRLTVVMFHRVLEAGDPRRAGADPEWTMDADTFRQCLRFFRRHYRVLTPQQALRALRGEAALPPASLLITFDDGWRDTADCAQPILDAFGMQALVFVAGCAIGQAAPFWQERVFCLLATDAGALARLAQACAQCGVAVALPERSDEAGIRQAVGTLERLGNAQRAAVLEQLGAAEWTPPAMIDAAQLAALAGAGHAIGGHGMTHTPLTRVADLAHELGTAQRTVAAHLGAPVETMSLPHGACNDAVLAACRAAGYRHLFTSEAHLNTLAPGQAATGPLGRIHISERALKGRAGRFAPAQLAGWLFLRPAQEVRHG
jgi:peptidoglycan/xylan/chitin deacetylase (PgdA/CDA1 family)